MTTASIIILTWQGMSFIAACLDAVFAQSYQSHDVIVVDNASTDGTADYVAAHYPQTRLIRNTRNAGFAAGCNMGIRAAANSDMIVLLNQDTVVERDWLSALAQATQQPGVGIVGCKCLYPDGRIQHAGGYLERPSGQPQHYGRGEPDRGQFDEPREVEFVTGAALAITRAALDAIGDLDEDLSPAYFEDIDWCFRARAAGFAVRYAPAARLVHHDGGSGRGAAQVIAFERARVGFMLKHLPRAALLPFAADERAQRQPISFGLEAAARARAYLGHVSRLHRIRAQREAIYGDDEAMRASDAEWDEVAANLLTAREAALRWARLRQLPVLPDPPPPDVAELEQRAALQEFTFTSRVPVVGGLISAFRAAWYGIAARWGVRDLARQQTEFNRQVSRALSLLAADDNELADQLRRASHGAEERGSRGAEEKGRKGEGGKGGAGAGVEEQGRTVAAVGAEATLSTAQRHAATVEPVEATSDDDPAAIARALWDEMIAPAAAQMDVAPNLSDDPNIFPLRYTVQHRNPVLGPVNSLLRRFINTEVRRYIDHSLRHQSRLNESFRDTLLHLLQENQRLRRELERLSKDDDTNQTGGASKPTQGG